MSDSQKKSDSEKFAALLVALDKNDARYVLIGGQALALHGFERATNDIDLLVPFDKENAKKIIDALSFLKSAKDIDPEWFSAESNKDEIQNIRVEDDLIVDIMFAANTENYESLTSHIKSFEVNGVTIHTLDIDGLLKTKTDFREKDVIDKAVLYRIKELNEIDASFKDAESKAIEVDAIQRGKDFER